MSNEIDGAEGAPTERDRPTPGSRLAHGVKLSLAGPLNILLGLLGLTRGALGLGIGSALAGARWAGDRCRSEEGGQDIALVQEAASSGRCRRPLLIVGVSVAVLALGGVVFSIVRRSMQPEPSSLQPSVDVTPQP